MLTHQAFTFELDPNDRAQGLLMSNAGASRFAYNWALDMTKNRMSSYGTLVNLAIREGASEERAKEWTVGLLGPPCWTAWSLTKEWNSVKEEIAPWWKENSKESYNSGLEALAKGLKNFFASRNGKRRRKVVGFPRFRKRGSRRSFRYTTGSFGVVNSRHVRLPRIGVVRIKGDTTKLLSLIESGLVHILRATISQRAGHWFVSFGVTNQRPDETPLEPNTVVGVDLGVKSLATLSTGEVIPNPKHSSRYAKRMERRQREMSRRKGPAKGTKPSNRWLKSKIKVGKLHYKVANVRKDNLHKVTTRLAKTYGTIVIENLNVAGMTAKAKGRGHAAKAGLTKSILDASFAEFGRQLVYKCGWYGSNLVIADQWYPSSKTCSNCKTVKAKLSLKDRTFVCENCDFTIGRDLNAAINLASLVKTVPRVTREPVEETQPNAQGEEKFISSDRCSSLNCENGVKENFE